ncbi:MAG TPA: hypothetical protein VHA52_12960, partial [Candidatus Babeliaceae bacterium]|nr:hypothetical protein [Candidatus Babeliaceae bacterium]
MNKSCRTIAIAWDLHNVLFRPNYCKLFFIFLKALRYPQLWLLGINPYFWRQVYRGRKELVVIEAVFKRLCLEFPVLTLHTQLFFEACNAQSPQAGVIALINKLKREGAVQYILSNIGQETFRLLSNQYPDLIDLFDGFYVSQEIEDYH